MPASISSVGKQIGNLPFTAFGKGGSLFGSGQLFGGLGFGRTAGSGGAFASLAPLLGLQLGAGLGGGGLGSIIGGIGGGLLGVGLTAAPAIFGAGGALASPLLAGLFSNPLTAVAGGALLISALILGKNKARRKDEQKRTQILLDSKSQMSELIRRVNTNKLDGGDALRQAGVIRSNYLTQVGQLKDKKTRKIAEQTVREIDAMTTTLREAADLQLKRQERGKALVPEFAGGGMTGSFTRAEMQRVLSARRGYDMPLELIKVKPGEQFLPPHEHTRLLERGGIIPGTDRGVDDTFMYAPAGSLIRNKKQQEFAAGGVVGGYPASSSASNERGDIHITVAKVSVDAENIVLEGLKSDDGRKVFFKMMQSNEGAAATAKNVRSSIRNNDL